MLPNGDEIDATVVLSSVDPRITFQKLCEPGALPASFLEDVGRYKFRGSSGKVNLALDALPDFTCLPGPGAHLRGAISISPSVEYMERAYDDAKYGDFSRRPYVDIVIPSLTDPSVAPPGKHVLSCFVQYAPYKLREGTWDEKREAFGDTVIDTLAEYAPNLKQIILHRQVLTPLDLEREWSLSEGNIFQGELSLEQLFFLRPVPGWARYRTPLAGLYMCGSATHPGGGIMGAPGRLAALEVLKDIGEAPGEGRRRRDRRRPERARRGGAPREGRAEAGRARAARGRGRRGRDRGVPPRLPRLDGGPHGGPAAPEARRGARPAAPRPRVDAAGAARLRPAPGRSRPQPVRRPGAHGRRDRAASRRRTPPAIPSSTRRSAGSRPCSAACSS